MIAYTQLVTDGHYVSVGIYEHINKLLFLGDGDMYGFRVCTAGVLFVFGFIILLWPLTFWMTVVASMLLGVLMMSAAVIIYHGRAIFCATYDLAQIMLLISDPLCEAPDPREITEDDPDFLRHVGSKVQ